MTESRIAQIIFVVALIILLLLVRFASLPTLWAFGIGQVIGTIMGCSLLTIWFEYKHKEYL